MDDNFLTPPPRNLPRAVLMHSRPFNVCILDNKVSFLCLSSCQIFLKRHRSLTPSTVMNPKWPLLRTFLLFRCHLVTKCSYWLLGYQVFFTCWLDVCICRYSKQIIYSKLGYILFCWSPVPPSPLIIKHNLFTYTPPHHLKGFLKLQFTI